MTSKAKVKKWIKRILIVIAVLLGLVWAVYDNLVSNSVYYAKYTPHKEGVEPQLMMVIEHLDDIYLPEMKEYRYKFDGMPAILLYDDHNKQIGFYTASIGQNESKYILDIIYHDRDVYFTFNSDFALIQATDYYNSQSAIPITSINKSDVVNLLQVQLKPLIDAQPLPDVNLQWLFDWVYHDKFN